MSNEEFENGKEQKCPDCGKAWDHWHLDTPEVLERAKKLVENMKFQKAIRGLEETRTVDTSNKGDLIDHMVNAHGFNPEFYKLVHPVHRSKYGSRMELNLKEIQDMHYLHHLATPVQYENNGTEHRHL